MPPAGAEAIPAERPSVSFETALAAHLLAARNPDGGWPYLAGRRSRLEPTALALLALSAGGTDVDPRVLTAWPRQEDLLLDIEAGSVNLASHAQAALVAQALGPTLESFAGRLVDALVAVKGVRLPPSPALQQDDGLQGWPWSPGTFSWVEPTAWALIAVRRWHRVRPSLDAAARVVEAERLLLDRACQAGGWNYGNPAAFGHNLRPHVPTTALALIALEPRHDEPAVARAQHFLRGHCLGERSGLALAMASLALGRAGGAWPDLDDALSRTWQTSAFLGNLATVALALYVLRGRADGYDAFTS